MGERLSHRGAHPHEWSPEPDVRFGERRWDDASDAIGFAAFDGALDNAAALCELLGVPRERSATVTDKELAWEVYQKFGLDGLGHLSGQFAVAIWDSLSQRLILACDRWGARPLYYTRTRGRAVFASEYKALLAIEDVPARWNPGAVLYAVRTHNANPRMSFLAGVEPVPRGSWVVLQQDRAETGQFTTIALEIVPRTGQEYAAAVRDALFTALRRQTEHLDVIGLALSGGLDSALVLAGIRHVAPEKVVHTFTVGHGDEDREIVGARETAGHFKTDHHEIIVGAENLPAVLPDAVWHMEDPVGGEEMIYSFIAAREAARYVDTVFTGEKSDALFAGMPRHLVLKYASALPPLRGVLEEFFHYTQIRRMPKSIAARMLVDFYYRDDKPLEVSVLGTESLPPPRRLPFDSDQPISAKLRQDILDGSSTLGATVQLHAAYGLSWNSPFMDPGMVRTAFGIPDHWKIRGRRQKYVLRRACEGLAPDSILKRKKSLQRLRNDMRLTEVIEGLSSHLLSPGAVSARGMFDPAQVESVRRRRGGAPYSREQLFTLWSLLITETWARLFIDGRGERPSRMR
jgi:asparagine synthase (glutamine-hydrolysing)